MPRGGGPRSPREGVDFAQLKPMVTSAERELERAGITHRQPPTDRVHAGA